jgi:hypothetical protein
VPAALVAVGFVLRARRGGRVAVLVGSALLVPATLFIAAGLLAVLLAGCQVTLLAGAILGCTGAGRPRRGIAMWVAVLIAPVLVSGVLQVAIVHWVWEADQAPPGMEAAAAFPVSFADGIEFVGPLVTEGVPSEIRGSFEMPPAEAMRAERSLLEREGWSVGAGPPGETSGTMTARRSGRTATLTFQQGGQAEDPATGSVVVHVEPL